MGRRGVACLSVAVAVAWMIPGAASATHRETTTRWCGPGWTTTPLPAIRGSGGLTAVDASSATDAWAVGHRFDPSDQAGHTLIEHHDGSSWSITPSADGPAALQSILSDVSARTATDAWAVGSFTRRNNLIRSLIERWNGSSWIRVPSPNDGRPANGDLRGVVTLAADDAWAVGSFTQGGPTRTLIEHWDGSSWSIVPSPNKGPFPNGLADIDAVAPDDIWAVGTWFTKAFADRTLTLHWDGSTWRRVPSPNGGPALAPNDLVSVAAVATDDVWAVGFRGLHTMTTHWDGATWSVIPSPSPGGLADLAAVVALGSDDVLAVGGSVDREANAGRTLVEHWNGASWTVVTSANKGPSDNHLWGISGVTGRMLAVGDRFSGGGNGPVVPLSLTRC